MSGGTWIIVVVLLLTVLAGALLLAELHYREWQQRERGLRRIYDDVARSRERDKP